MTEIDDKLLEQQEQEQKEREGLVPQFERGGNGNNKEEGSVAPTAYGELEQSKEQEQEGQEQNDEDKEKELAKIKLAMEDIDFMFKTMMKESKYDEISIKQTVHGLNSAFTRLPIPHISTSEKSGAGKSYIVNHIAEFYPDKYITRSAGMSDKALFHLDGPMIVVKDEETGEFELLDDILGRLETEREECEEEIRVQGGLKKQGGSFDRDLIKAMKSKIKEIESEEKNIEKSAQKLIDLDNKILIVQDTPSSQFFNQVMPILSQDTTRDQEYAFTDKSSNGKLFANKNRIRGMPVIMTTQVIDDTDTARFEEKNRRFIHISPNTSAEKIKEANRLNAFRYGYLPVEYDKLVVSRTDIARAKKIVKIIAAKLKQQKKYLGPKESGVKVPFALALEESLPVEEGEVWKMTVGERTMKYLSMVTKLCMDCRPRLVHKETGAFYPISAFEDLKETMTLMERGGSRVRPYLQQWFNDAFVKCFAKLDGKPKEYQNEFGNVYCKEEVVGLTTEDLAKETGEDLNYIRKKYLDPLVNLGLVQKTLSIKDGRTNIYLLPDNSHDKDNDNNDKDKILVKDSSLYPTKNVIIESFRTVIEYDADGPHYFEKKSEYEILDENGERITLEQLADRYFANPEMCFKRGFE
jgi:hypothetical protein